LLRNSGSGRLSEEHAAIRDAVRGFLAERASMAHVRAALESEDGWSRQIWRGLAGELGFAGLAIAEEHGGAGLGVRELAIVAEELGGALAPIPWFETAVLSATLLSACAAYEHLPRVASGQCIATLAWRDASGKPDAIGPELRDGRLHGAAHYVSFGHVADLLLVAARTGDSVALCAIDSHARGVATQKQTSLDLARPFATITFDGASATILDADATLILAYSFAMASAVLAAEQVGAAARVLDDTVAYSKQRVQFGRVIGSFQAMKHRMADMKLELEAARSAAAWALDALETEATDLQLACSGARAACSDAFLHIASEGVQLLGGIGFTWEHSAHLYFKRARASSTLLDSPAHQREIVARALLDERTT
jgi:alkylation response protein AidB-like acyl-CoA dehydrogenase